jgi:hypothetical protein
MEGPKSKQAGQSSRQVNPVEAGKREGPKSKKAGQYMSRQVQDQNEKTRES